VNAQQRPSPEGDEQIDNLPPILITAAAVAITATIAVGAYHFGSYLVPAFLL
jgi:hypothetical protein